MALFRWYKSIDGKGYLPPYDQPNGPLRMLNDEVDAAWVQFDDKKVSLNWLITSVFLNPFFNVGQLLFDELDVFFLPYMLSTGFFVESLVIKRLIGDVDWNPMSELFHRSELSSICITVEPSVATAAVAWDVAWDDIPQEYEGMRRSPWMDVAISTTQIFRGILFHLRLDDSPAVTYYEFDFFNNDGSVARNFPFANSVEARFRVTENVSRLLEGKFKVLQYKECWVAHVDVCNNLNGLITCNPDLCGIQVVRDVDRRRARQELKAFVSCIKKVLHVDEYLLRHIGTFLGVGKGWIT
jgi:hypothetical protein